MYVKLWSQFKCPSPCAMWDLSSREPESPALELWSLNHWATREIPLQAFQMVATSLLASLLPKVCWGLLFCLCSCPSFFVIMGWFIPALTLHCQFEDLRRDRGQIPGLIPCSSGCQSKSYLQLSLHPLSYLASDPAPPWNMPPWVSETRSTGSLSVLTWLDGLVMFDPF